ncbi:ABC transporter permease [Aquicella lusitana]|uniref:Transport permease protein n=1 Tax=Aquicella lusitana TaxID=254246 RepID=A0A370GG08_9COXI|nr:ABC transporter permease [Aquicella lusitana]RDI41324.1 ABC-2 type transport system permease protein [Aquicella lusitana]VVC72310.1 Inner membrane transport permease YadH [Aquicella lusitana]
MTSRTGLYPTLVALETILRKEIFRFMRIWTQTLLPPAITMSLYFIIFGKFIGSQIRDVQGFSYIQYIVPGLVMMSVMTNSYANTASSFFLTKFNKSIEEMVVSPMPSFVILLGFMLGGTLRGLLVGIIVMLISLLFTHVPLFHPFIILLMAILSAMVFSLGGLINGVYAKRFDDISFIPTFVLTPLTYLGGVFYSIQQLPPTWRTLSLLNPILDMVDTFRFGMLGVSDLNVYLGFSLVSILFIALFFWAWALLHKGVGIKV